MARLLKGVFLPVLLACLTTFSQSVVTDNKEKLKQLTPTLTGIKGTLGKPINPLKKDPIHVIKKPESIQRSSVHNSSTPKPVKTLNSPKVAISAQKQKSTGTDWLKALITYAYTHSKPQATISATQKMLQKLSKKVKFSSISLNSEPFSLYWCGKEKKRLILQTIKQEVFFWDGGNNFEDSQQSENSKKNKRNKLSKKRLTRFEEIVAPQGYFEFILDLMPRKTKFLQLSQILILMRCMSF